MDSLRDGPPPRVQQVRATDQAAAARFPQASGTGHALARSIFNLFSATPATPSSPPDPPYDPDSFRQMAAGFGLWGGALPPLSAGAAPTFPVPHPIGASPFWPLGGAPSPSPPPAGAPQLAVPENSVDTALLFFAPDAGLLAGDLFGTEEGLPPPLMVPPFGVIGPARTESGPRGIAGERPPPVKAPRGRPRKPTNVDGAALDKQRELKRDRMQRRRQADRGIPSDISALDGQVREGGRGG